MGFDRFVASLGNQEAEKKIRLLWFLLFTFFISFFFFISIRRSLRKLEIDIRLKSSKGLVFG